MPTLFRNALFTTLTACVLFAGCARAPRREATLPVMPPPQAVVTSPQAAGFYHTVVRGETIYRIAKNYRVDQKELMRANGINDPSQLEVGRQIFVPQRRSFSVQPALPGPLSEEAIRRLVGPPRTRSIWRTITLHHSGTLQGSAKAFHRDHTRRHMGGLFYHFVIGNGTSTANGSLEVGFRWKKQKPANRPNDIQICLVGDFNQQQVSEAQFSTMVNLVRMLMRDYGIPLSNVRKHEDIKGKHTACPGSHFPFARLLDELASRP